MGTSTWMAGGIIVGLLIVIVVFKFVNKDKRVKTEYDERQKAVRGTSYMYAFYGMAIANLILLLIAAENMEYIKILGINAFFIPILVGIIVQVSHSIFNDSYKGLNNNMTRYMAVMTFVSIINVVCGILPWVEKGFIWEGEIYPNFLNLEVGVMFVIICIEMAIKKHMDKKAIDD